MIGTIAYKPAWFSKVLRFFQNVIKVAVLLVALVGVTLVGLHG